ncbi:conserved membrane hypothetical protein [Vibrio rotiferianus]|uniref:hypothetical protein n=1 Tax=Vibrio rotiferianus TaxID=190895 RepID=UPI002895C5DA|nr:conserved membrane hypothetical protein [Vibrio rotiferianus]
MKNNKICYWRRLKGNVLGVPKKSIENPKFVFSFFIIMVISSAGVWVPWAFSLELSSVCNISQESLVLKEDSFIKKRELELGVYKAVLFEKSNTTHLDSTKLKESIYLACDYISSLPVTLFQGFAVFMFNLGILGGIAFDFFMTQGPKKYEKNDLTPDKLNEERVNDFAGFSAWIVAFILSFYGLTAPTSFSFFTLVGTVIAVSLWICVNHNKADFRQPKTNPGNIVAENDNIKPLAGGGLK